MTLLVVIVYLVLNTIYYHVQRIHILTYQTTMTLKCASLHPLTRQIILLLLDVAWKCV